MSQKFHEFNVACNFANTPRDVFLNPRKHKKRTCSYLIQTALYEMSREKGQEIIYSGYVTYILNYTKIRFWARNCITKVVLVRKMSIYWITDE